MVTFVAQVEISLTVDELQGLRVVADRFGCDVSDVVRNSIKETIEAHAKEICPETTKRTFSGNQEETVLK